ncbi:hypothetical protein V6N11_075745 [Hibiscus sabdariffa]|uniref:Uncharacterized protein n=2 Tax=Hibiscus sabdariffa TaxID=183260 RepID=A0ABR2A8H1_9ROSI
MIGLVSAHWKEDESSRISPKWWDGNGILNSTTKYKEDQKTKVSSLRGSMLTNHGFILMRLMKRTQLCLSCDPPHIPMNQAYLVAGASCTYMENGLINQKGKSLQTKVYNQTPKWHRCKDQTTELLKPRDSPTRLSTGQLRELKTELNRSISINETTYPPSSFLRLAKLAGHPQLMLTTLLSTHHPHWLSPSMPYFNHFNQASCWLLDLDESNQVI